jgi:hypothetical protein
MSRAPGEVRGLMQEAARSVLAASPLYRNLCAGAAPRAAGREALGRGMAWRAPPG